MADKPHYWELDCLLCGATPEDADQVDQERRRLYGSLVALQEHAMIRHDVTQDDLIRQERVPPLSSSRIDVKVYKWKLPSGQLWLRAIKREVKPIGTSRA